MSRYFRHIDIDNLTASEKDDFRILGQRAFLNQELVQTEVCMAASLLSKTNANGPDGTIASLKEAYEQLYTS